MDQNLAQYGLIWYSNSSQISSQLLYIMENYQGHYSVLPMGSLSEILYIKQIAANSIVVDDWYINLSPCSPDGKPCHVD